MSQLSLFDVSPVLPPLPVLHIPFQNTMPATSIGKKPPGSPGTVRERVEKAEATGKQLIRFDARPWDKQWVIKLHNNAGGGSWGYLHRFDDEAEAKAKFQEMLDSGNYLDGMSAQLDLFGYGYIIPTPPSSRPAPGSTLLDILGLDEGEVLICTRHQTKDNTAEQRLLGKVRQMMKGWSLPNFTVSLRDWMRYTSVGNNACFWHFYKIISNDEFAEIWHTTADGEPDRHVCTITKPIDE